MDHMFMPPHLENVSNGSTLFLLWRLYPNLPACAHGSLHHASSFHNIGLGLFPVLYSIISSLYTISSAPAIWNSLPAPYTSLSPQSRAKVRRSGVARSGSSRDAAKSSPSSHWLGVAALAHSSPCCGEVVLRVPPIQSTLTSAHPYL